MLGEEDVVLKFLAHSQILLRSTYLCLRQRDREKYEIVPTCHFGFDTWVVSGNK